MDEVGKILPSLFRKQIRREEPHLLEVLQPLWPRIAGKTMAQHSQPAVFASGVLTLNTDCPAWNAQMRQMAEQIRSRINGFLGQPVVRKLRIKKVAEAGLFAAPGLPCGATAPVPAANAMDTAAIADPELAAALANSYAKYFTPRTRRN